MSLGLPGGHGRAGWTPRQALRSITPHLQDAARSHTPRWVSPTPCSLSTLRPAVTPVSPRTWKPEAFVQWSAWAEPGRLPRYVHVHGQLAMSTPPCSPPPCAGMGGPSQLPSCALGAPPASTCPLACPRPYFSSPSAPGPFLGHPGPVLGSCGRPKLSTPESCSGHTSRMVEHLLVGLLPIVGTGR